MAKTKISEYDSTAANNTDIDSINIAEGCAPSGINNAIRELMAHLKDMNIGSTITMLNTTEEDSDGGRANKIIFKGEQSGGEESVLGEIQASHDGTADDQKGDLIFKTNDGSDGTSPTEALRIDSSQNVGIGCVPNSIQSGFDTLQIGGNLTLNVDGTGAGAGVYMGNNVYRDSGNSRWEYTYTDEASQYLQAGGEHIWRYAASGTADTAITWSEAMRIDSSGGIKAGTGARFLAASTGVSTPDYSFAADDTMGMYRSPGALCFANGSTERMRIDNSSNILFGLSTANSFPTGNNFVQINEASGVNMIIGGHSGTHTVIQFRHNGATTVGSIVVNASSTTYNTSSDYRLKENVTDVTDGITRVKQLAPKRFNFIVDADTTVDGFLAHEAQAVVPEAITGTKDAMKDEEYTVTAAKGDVYTPATGDADEIVHSSNVEQPDTLEEGQQWRETAEAVMGTRTVPDMQGIDQSKLVPLLTAALQEAIAKIEALETRVAALEG